MICEICKKIFKTFSSLKKHINKNHNNTTFEKYCLKYLIKDINEQYCELCGEKKRFIGKENLMYKQYCGICAKKSESSKEKRRNTNINKFGVNAPIQNKIYMQKLKNTISEKYGVDNISKLDKIKKLKKEIYNKKYGSNTPLQNEEIKEKQKHTVKNKYNVENVSQIELTKLKRKITYLNKYGEINPTKNKNISSKISKTKIKNMYEYINHSDRLGKNIIPLFNENEYNGVDFKYKFKCLKCDNEFYDHLADGRKPRCLICYPYYVSKLEIDIREYIQSVYNGELIFNDRQIISPLELDIVLPKLNLAIEVNGTFWHGPKCKSENYHEIKSSLCEKNGYNLLYVWEHEWNNEKENIKEVLNKLIIGK